MFGCGVVEWDFVDVGDVEVFVVEYCDGVGYGE